MRRKIWKYAIYAALVVVVGSALNVGLLLGTRNMWRRHQLKVLAADIQTASNGMDEARAIYAIHRWAQEHRCSYIVRYYNADTGEIIPYDKTYGYSIGLRDTPNVGMTIEFESWYNDDIIYAFSFRPKDERYARHFLDRGLCVSYYLGWP